MTENEKQILQTLYNNKISRYRIKPGEIEAFQYKGCVIDIPWIDIEIPIKENFGCYIQTYSGVSHCGMDDYIIKENEGSYRVVNSDLFESMYEKIED